jgi:hypothetical protein
MAECDPQRLADVLDGAKGTDLSAVWTTHNTCMEEIYFPKDGSKRNFAESTALVNDYMKKVSAVEKKNSGVDLTIIDPETTNEVVTYRLTTEAQRKR